MRWWRISRVQRRLEVFLQRGLLRVGQIPGWWSTQVTPWWWSTTVVDPEPYWEAGRTAWYTWVLPLTKGLPAGVAGWWYLQWWYGAGYYQYRFTLIAMVDNYRVVDLHAVGYLRWRGWWRTTGYPRLVRWFPKWGNLTSSGVYLVHHLVEHTTTAGGTRWYRWWTTLVNQVWTAPTRVAPTGVALGFRPTQRIRQYRIPPVKLPWRPIKPKVVWNPPRRAGWQPWPGGRPGRWLNTGLDGPHRVGATPVGHPGGPPPSEETTLADREWLSLDGVFPFPGDEPFQEDMWDYLEDQQDDHHDDDEEPAHLEDTLYGTGSGLVQYEDIDGTHWTDGFNIMRRVDPLDMPRVPPYRLHPGVVTSFHPRGAAQWDNILGGGDGPTPEEVDRNELDIEENPLTEVADWYTYVAGSDRLTDDDPLTNDWTGWWRTRRRSQPHGVVTAPDRLYTLERLHPRWWLFQWRPRSFRAWKKLLRQWRRGWLRRPHRRHRPVAGPTQRIRTRRGQLRYTRVKRWHRPRWDEWLWTWRRWPTRFPARYWRGWATRAGGTREMRRTPGVGWDFAQRHQAHLEREGLALPSGWARWVLPRHRRLHTPAGYYPRYEPLHTGRAATVGVVPWGDTRGLPVGWWWVAAALVVDYVAGAALAESWVLPGVGWGSVSGGPHWWEHYRLAPPRGWWSWPGNPGVDANLYVWGWLADYFVPFVDGTGEANSPDYLPGSFSWRSYSDARHYRGRYKFYPSFPPWLPSYLMVDPRFHTLGLYGRDMWIPGEPSPLARSVNTRYFRTDGVPPMMYRALTSWYLHDPLEGLVYNSTVDAWSSSLFMHLANPTWTGPREYLGGGEPPRLDARWVHAWGEISPTHNWPWVSTLKRGLGHWSWGRSDWTTPWGWSPERYSRGWAHLGGTSPWEVHLNQALLEGWHTTAVATYAERPRGGLWGWTPPGVDLPWVEPARWWFYTVGIAWWWCRTVLVVGVPTGVGLHPARRWTPRARPIPTGPGGFHPDGGGRRHRRNHQWRGIRKYDERHTLVEDYGFDWRWNGWYHYFSVAREGHNPLAPHRDRRAGPRARATPVGGVPTGVARVGGRPTRGASPTTVAVTPPGWAPPRVGTYWRATSGWPWLVRGVRPPVRVVLPDHTAVFPDNPRNEPHLWQRTSEISEFPGSLRRPTRRYRGVERAGWLDHPWRAGHQPDGPPRVWRVTPGWWAIRVAHTWWATGWRTTLRGVAHPGGVTPGGVTAVTHLAGVTWPGWTGLYEGVPPEAGYDVGVYHDDHNELYLGLQGDDEYAEWNDLENPLAQHHGVRYLTPEVDHLVGVTTPVWTLAGYPRWGVAPTAYTGGYPTTYFSEGAHPVGWMTWSPAGVDHPVYEVTTLVGYGVPRWYRRVTRWARPRWAPTGGVRPGGRPDWRGPWRRPTPGGYGRPRVYEVYDPAGGDLLWDTPGAALVDELYQTGWVHQDAPGAEWAHDDWDALPVGGLSGLGVGYRSEVYLTLGQRPRWDPTVWTTGGLNGGRYLLGGATPADPEGYWLDWLGHTYDEYTDGEAWFVEGGHVVDRAPEDPHENPNPGEYSEEVPRPRGGDLPGWVVAAAVAGVSPGEYDPGARVDRLTTEVGHPAHPVTTARVDTRITTEYYRAWARYRRGGSHPGGPQRPRWLPLPDDDVGVSAGVANPLYTALHPVETGDMLPGGAHRLQRDAPVREHLRLWALTEVYYDDGVTGPHLGA